METENIFKTIDSLSPEQTLKRGFSITCTDEGKTVRSIQELTTDTVIVTRVKRW